MLLLQHPQPLKFCGGDKERCCWMPHLPKADIAAFTHMQSIIAYCPPITSITFLSSHFTLPQHLGTTGLETVDFLVTP